MAHAIPDSIDKAKPVLVVDDLPAARRIVVRMLKILQFTNVIEAQSQAEAIEKIRENAPLLVITDLHLKDGLGTELLATTRSDPSLNSVSLPFLVITSDMDKESFTSAIKSGITSYLLKPFSKEMLAERIASALTPPA